MGFYARAHRVPCLGKPAITSKASFVGLAVFRWVRRHGFASGIKIIEKTEQLSITIH